MSTFEAAIPTIFEHEGDGGGRAVRGDPGSFTRWGITAATLGAWRKLGRDATQEEVAALSRDEAAAIYKARYWRSLYEQIRSQLVATKLFDSGVNMGPHEANLHAQRAINRCWPAAIDGRPAIPLRVVEDGQVTQVEVDALNALDETQALLAIGREQAAHYRAWVAADPAEREHLLAGLLNRAAYPFHPAALGAA